MTDQFYTMYRATTLGDTLDRTLEDFVNNERIPRSLQEKIMARFDKALSKGFSNLVRSRITFKSNKLAVYRYCDNVWTFLLNQTDVKDGTTGSFVQVQRLKIVACEAKK